MSGPRQSRPSSGGGSCASCNAALGLDAVKARRPDGDVWYCSPTCAQGMPASGRRRPVVPESRLYHRPQRFHGKRRPKELRSGSRH